MITLPVLLALMLLSDPPVAAGRNALSPGYPSAAVGDGPGTVSLPKLLILLCTALRYSLINRRDAETASTEPTSKNNTRMRLISSDIGYGSIFYLYF